MNVLPVKAKFIVLSVILFSCIKIAEAQYIDRWGMTSRGTAWPMLNDSSTVPGNASMGLPESLNLTTWATIRGGFSEPIAIEADGQAIVISGQLEFIGGDVGVMSFPSPFRYALTFQDSSTLQNQYTDSALWISAQGHFGYEFTPKSGNPIVLYGYPAGSVWTIDGGIGWNSIYLNNGWIISTANQIPRYTEIMEGVYNWAISVEALSDSTNEVRWYLIEQNNRYWFGGVAIDTAQVSTKFNGICFGILGLKTPLHQFNLAGVKVEKGAPITIPEAPWVPYYINQWGLTSQGTNRPLLNDSFPDPGNASLGAHKPQNAWATIRGGFEKLVTIKADGQAIILSGKLEYVGGSYLGLIPLRYALTFQDSAVLQYQYTDSAIWASSKGHYGYEFNPRSHPLFNDSTVYTINDNIRWNSTWQNKAIAKVNQVPHNAQIKEGIYNWAISVEAKSNGMNEIRWYLIEQNNQYWNGGIAIDSAQISTKFNGISFGIADGINSDLRQFNLYEVRIDKGAPIEVPPAPWEPYYISDWGVFGGRMANDWNFVPGEFDGDAGVAGNVPPVGNWSAIRGGFNEPVMATLEEPVTITGKIEFIGAGPETYSALRYGLFYHDSAGVLLNAGTDSAYWNGVEDRATGYMFSPTSGTNVHANGTRGAGTLWRIDGGRWISTLHNNPWPIGLIKQSPHNAVATAGKYDFAISVKPQKDGTKELRFYLLKEDFVYNPKYFFGGIMIDTALTPSIYNDVCFAFRGDTSNIRSMKLTEIKVSRDEITIGGGDEIPGYLYKWAFIGDRTGGWKTTPGEYDGNVSISGDEPNTDWVAIRGEFDGPINIQENKELIVNGKLEFVNGGFESANSLRFGIFYSDSAGYPIIKPDSSIHWSGMENHHSGYLLIPPSGFSIPPSWEGGNQTGNCGAVVDDIWFNTSGMSSYPLGTVIQQPSNADATAGTYRFEIALRRMADSTTAVKASLIKEDEPVSYYFSVDSINSKKLSPTDKFNCVAFALDTGNTTTAINLVDVQYDMRNWVPVIENKSEVGKPEIFSLFQNYPNPFNPTTVISYKLPVTSDVCIKVYDLLGREVATVFEGVKTAGNYSVNFDASRLAGGIYLYQLKAGNHVEAKKFVLLK